MSWKKGVGKGMLISEKGRRTGTGYNLRVTAHKGKQGGGGSVGKKRFEGLSSVTDFEEKLLKKKLKGSPRKKEESFPLPSSHKPSGGF